LIIAEKRAIVNDKMIANLRLMKEGGRINHSRIVCKKEVGKVKEDKIKVRRKHDNKKEINQFKI
jgi:uncharacterized protein YggL (DUF469 family)